jgi:CBS-domain-containing membrane protein
LSGECPLKGQDNVRSKIRVALRINTNSLISIKTIKNKSSHYLMKTILIRVFWVSIGASVAIALALLATKATSPLLLASLGGTLFLFGLSTTPAAQPRAVFGGHLFSSLIGIIFFQYFGDATWVSVAAVVITICVLLLTRTVHPPAGANPLIMIQAHANFSQIGLTVLVGISIITVIAWIWSRLGFGAKTYPVSWTQPSPPTTNWGIWGE